MFTAAAVTIESLVGWTTTHPLPSPTGCTFPGTISARGQGIFVRFSTDNGLTWTNERQLSTTFFRNVQITGDKVTGDVYVAAMDEMGGGLTNRANKIYRSTDGGNTWTNTYTVPRSLAQAVALRASSPLCTPAPRYWRHMGWASPPPSIT